MKLARRDVMGGVLAVAMLLQAHVPGAQASEAKQTDPAPLAVYGATTTLEIAPLLLAVKEIYPDGPEVQMGNIARMVSDEVKVDVAGNAETQLLRHSVNRPDLRAIMTVVEGKYRIVARRSAGINRLADLKGKRIATLRATSADYFLARMLEQGGLTEADVTTVPMVQREEIGSAFLNHEIDALAIWEPFSENALHALGGDAIEFSGEGIYAERYNLNTTAAALADPVKRKQIVELLQAVIRATEKMNHDPSEAQALVAKTAGFTVEEVARAWPHHNYYAGFASDMLDVLVDEEKWLAALESRQPRTREKLAELLDRSVYDEARAGLAK